MNPRRFPLPVFKTGALGHYASPPWANLLEEFRVAKSIICRVWSGLLRKAEQFFNNYRYPIKMVGFSHKFSELRSIDVAISHRPGAICP